MSGDGGQFLEACGATGPLELEWDDWESGEPVRRAFDRPAVLVGRNPRADLVLDHPGVSKRHAYLQVIEGRLHAIDLESRDGLRWSGVPRKMGWIDRGRPMQIGPATLRVVGEDRPEGREAGAGPGPLSSRFAPGRSLPDVVLEIRGAEGGPTLLAMERALMLVGSSPTCAVRLPESEASRFACALVRTPLGVWMVDLLSSRGVSVNGVACREARLEDRDVLHVGARSIRLTYGGPAHPPARRVAALAPAPIGRPAWPIQAPPDPGHEAWELIPEMVLGQLQDGAGPAPDASAPFNQALLMLVRLLGDIHRDHLEVVREEMEQIRRLNREMGTLRAQLPRPDPAVGGAGPAPGPSPEGGEDVGSIPDDLAHDRPDPQAVQAIVGKRLAAWEKERQGRWRKVIDLLVKP